MDAIWSVLIEGVSLFQRLFCTPFYVAGTTGGVLILEVLNSEVPPYTFLCVAGTMQSVLIEGLPSSNNFSINSVVLVYGHSTWLSLSHSVPAILSWPHAFVILLLVSCLCVLPNSVCVHKYRVCYEKSLLQINFKFDLPVLIACAVHVHIVQTHAVCWFDKQC